MLAALRVFFDLFLKEIYFLLQIDESPFQRETSFNLVNRNEMRYCFSHHLNSLRGWTHCGYCQLDLELLLQKIENKCTTEKLCVVPGGSSSQAHRESFQTALCGDNSPASSLSSSSAHLNHLSWNHGSYNGVNSER